MTELTQMKILGHSCEMELPIIIAPISWFHTEQIVPNNLACLSRARVSPFNV